MFVVAPPAVWVFTFFSFKIAYAFHQLPYLGNPSFFFPDNFLAYFNLYFPFLQPHTDFSRPAFYFSLYGFLAGLTGSFRMLSAEQASKKSFRRMTAKPVLLDEEDRKAQQFTWTVAVSYGLLIIWFILKPGWIQGQGNAREQVIRVASAIYLFMPVYFTLGMALFGKRQAGPSRPSGPEAKV